MDNKKLKKRSRQGALISSFGLFLVLFGFGLASMKLISLNKEIATESKNLIVITDSINVKTIENYRLEQRNITLEIQNKDLLNLLSSKNENTNTLSGNVKTLDKQVRKLSDTLASKSTLINNLNDNIAINTEDLLNLKRQAVTAQDELKEKRETVRQLDERISNLDIQLEKLKSETNALNSYWDNNSDKNNSDIVPKATSTKTGKYYDFKIWLDIPASQLKKINTITYFFNHKSFRFPKVVVENPNNGFETVYTGWGCLANMPITITYNNGKEETIVFKMCEYINDASIRIKGGNIVPKKNGSIKNKN